MGIGDRRRGFVKIGIYGIMGFSGFGKRLFVFGLAGVSVMAKSAGWAKWNPENPDSDKTAAWSAVLWIPTFAGMTRVKSGMAGGEIGNGVREIDNGDGVSNHRPLTTRAC